MQRIDKARVERIARLCSDNAQAGASLGIHPRSFSRLCSEYNIETPRARRRRLRQQQCRPT